MVDTCYAQHPVGLPWPKEIEESSWVVVGASYGPDYIGTDREWVETYSDLIRLNEISPCGWSAIQTMYYGPIASGPGTACSTSTIGMWLDGVRVMATRGGAEQYCNLGPD